MASLTDYLNGPTGGKPIIATEVQSVDVFGTVANFVGAVAKARPDAPTASQVKDAKAAEGMNVFTTGVEQILSGEVPVEVKDHATRIGKMKRAGMSTTQIDAEIQSLIKRVKAKYPEGADKYYAWLNDNGLDDFVFRESKRKLETSELIETARDDTFKKNFEEVRSSGFDTERMSPWQVQETARRINREKTELTETNAWLDLYIKRNGEVRAQEDQTWQAEDRATTATENDRKAAEGRAFSATRNLVSLEVNPMITAIAKANEQLINNEIQEKDFAQTLTGVLTTIEAKRIEATASLPNMTSDQKTLLDKQFDDYKTFVTSLLDGDASANKARLRNLAAWESKVKIEATEKFPFYTTVETLLGQEGVAWMLQGIESNSPFMKASQDEAVNLTQWLTGKQPGVNQESTVTDKWIKALQSENPSETARLEGLLDQTYKDVTLAAAGTLPQMRTQLLNNPTKEAATYFSRAFSSLAPEIQAIPRKTGSSEAHVRTVLKQLPPDETLAAIGAYKAAGGNETNAEYMTKVVSNAYLKALDEMYRDYTSSGLSSSISFMKTGGGLGRGPVSKADTTPKVSFNEDTGMFQHNGNPSGNIWTGTSSTKIVEQMNTLLQGAVDTERALGNLPSDFNDIGARGYILGTVNGAEKFDMSVLDYMNEKGYPVTTAGEVLKQGEVKKEEAAKAAPKKTEAPASPLDVLKAFNKTASDPMGRVAASFTTSQPLAEILSSEPEVAKLYEEIVSKESGSGGYQTLYDQSQTNDFAGTDITKMTINELLEFNDPQTGEYGKWAKERKISAAPMGKYQIIRSTMKSLVNELGLTGEELFDETLQDAMFVALLNRRLKPGQNLADEWVALRGTEYDRKN